MTALAGHGLHASTIPINLGGQWTYDCVDEWLLGRLQIENKPMKPPPPPLLPSNSVPALANQPRAAIPNNHNNHNPEHVHINPIQQLNQQTEPTFPSAGAFGLNQRQHGETIQAAQWQGAKDDDVVVETELIRQACDALSNKDVPSEEVQRVRERNTLAARRSYHKRKRETAALKNQVDQLNREQKALLAEQQQLEELHQRAKRIVKAVCDNQ